MSDDLFELDRLQALQDTPLPGLAPAELVRRRGLQRRHRTRVALAGAGAAVVLLGTGSVLALSGGTTETLQPAGPAPATSPAGPTTSPLPAPSASATPPAAQSTPARPSTAPTTASARPSSPRPASPTAPPSPSSPSPTLPAFPPDAGTGTPGSTAWAVYLDVARNGDDPGLNAAVRQARAVGYQTSPFDISCDRGARETLGLEPGVHYSAVAVYFATQQQARQFVDAYQPGVVGTAFVTVQCND